MLDQETKDLIRDLYLSYADLHVNKELDGRAVCVSCFELSELDLKTGQWPKPKHRDDCAVTIMKNRVRKAIEGK